RYRVELNGADLDVKLVQAAAHGRFDSVRAIHDVERRIARQLTKRNDAIDEPAVTLEVFHELDDLLGHADRSLDAWTLPLLKVCQRRDARVGDAARRRFLLEPHHIGAHVFFSPRNQRAPLHGLPSVLMRMSVDASSSLICQTWLLTVV